MVISTSCFWRKVKVKCYSSGQCQRWYRMRCFIPVPISFAEIRQSLLLIYNAEKKGSKYIWFYLIKFAHWKCHLPFLQGFMFSTILLYKLSHLICINLKPFVFLFIDHCIYELIFLLNYFLKRCQSYII